MTMIRVNLPTTFLFAVENVVGNVQGVKRKTKKAYVVTSVGLVNIPLCYRRWNMPAFWFLAWWSVPVCQTPYTSFLTGKMSNGLEGGSIWRFNWEATTQAYKCIIIITKRKYGFREWKFGLKQL